MRPAVRKVGHTNSANLERACVATFHCALISLIADIAFGCGHRDGVVVLSGTGGWHHVGWVVGLWVFGRWYKEREIL